MAELTSLSRVGQQHGLSVTRAHLERRLSGEESLALTVLLDQIAAAYPNQEIHPDTADVWREGIEALALKHGMRRVRDVLADLLIQPGRKFFPQPGEIAEALEQMKAEETKQIRQDNPFEPCADCDRGFIRVNKADGRKWDGGISPTLTRLEECRCHVAYRRKMAQLLESKPQVEDRKAKAAGE